MITEEQAALLAQPNTAIIGVNRAKGGPQLTVVWYVWNGKDFSFSITCGSCQICEHQTESGYITHRR